MPSFDLLNAVQPDEGWFCVVGIKGKKVKQSFYQTREEVDATVDQLVQNGSNAFFGVAKYKNSTSRTKDNVAALKAFWLDIDCGEEKAAQGKGYETQGAGLQALKSFCAVADLPIPVIVDSGRGLHVYWPLEDSITREEWEPVAEALRVSCLNHGLIVDPAVFEVARILRVPGTKNFKGTPPTPVTVVNPGEAVNFGVFRDKLGVKTASVALVKPAKRPLTPLALALRGNETSLFSKIMMRTPGCAQLTDCYRNRATLPEPRWVDALSIAKFCEDKDAAIHKISSGHPDYDPAATELKIQHIAGPHTCAVFERNNPGGCAGCPHSGKFKSPIALGRDLATRGGTEDPEEGEEPQEGEEGEETPEGEEYKIPECPAPFIWGDNGALYIETKEVKNKKGEIVKDADVELVYEYPLYVVKRMEDPVLGNVIVLRLHLPKDGVKQFVISNACVSDKNELRSELAKKGVLAYGGRFELLTLYLYTSIKNLQFEKKAENMRLQFGWADNFSKFIIGDREISTVGTFHSPPSSATREVAENMVPMGTLDKWKEVFALYGQPGLEPHAFGALTAFGSPLFGFLGQSGAAINVINQQSGQGKSTILHMCNSVYGHPKKLCFKPDDTNNGRTHKLGVFNNLPVCLDEMTNIGAKDLSDLIYAITQGSGKDRMMMSNNELRKNFARWNLLALCSSNSSFYDKLGVLKNNPDGEMMRAMEYHIDLTTSIDAAYAKQMFDHQLFENYGHAGDIYARFLVNNLDYAKNKVLELQVKIDKEMGLTQRERFWSSILAANFAGGMIAKDLELLSWKIGPIYMWAASMVDDIRKDVSPPLASSIAVVSDFVTRHLQNTLVVNDSADRRTNMPMLPSMEPKGNLIIRSEPDTNKMFIMVKPFREDCSKSQTSYKETLKDLKAKGVLLDVANKRISKGMKIDVGTVACLVLDRAHPEFTGVSKMVDIAAEESKTSADSGN